MSFTQKIEKEAVDNLTEKEINSFIDEFWLSWTCKFELSPCGQLTLRGKREYIENNLDEVKALIQFEKENGRFFPKTSLEDWLNEKR